MGTSIKFANSYFFRFNFYFLLFTYHCKNLKLISIGITGQNMANHQRMRLLKRDGIKIWLIFYERHELLKNFKNLLFNGYYYHYRPKDLIINRCLKKDILVTKKRFIFILIYRIQLISLSTEIIFQPLLRLGDKSMVES